MKMTKEHYKALKEKISMVKNNIHKDIQNDTHSIWDIFHAAKIFAHYSYQEFDYLDTQIETAIRKILKEL